MSKTFDSRVERLDDPDPLEEVDLSLPPHDPYAESAVLGSILKSDHAMARVVSDLRSEDFYSERNRLVYAAFEAIFKRNEPIDYTLTVDELQRQGTYERAGGVLYLSEINLATSSSMHILHYAKIVRDHATRRRGIQAAQSIAEIYYERREDVEDAHRRAQARLYGVAGRDASKRLIFPEQWASDLFDRLGSIDEDGTLGVSTGWIDLDKSMLGLPRDGLVLIAARPGMGKSELAEQMALNVATGVVAPNFGCRAGTGWSLFISIEMTQQELEERAVSQWAPVNKDRLIRGHMVQAERDRILNALNRLNDCRLAFAIESGITTADVRALALQLEAEKGPLDAIFVDYVQLLRDKAGDGDNTAQNLGVAVNALKNLARDLHCTVIAPAQLSRGVEDRSPPIPILRDLRDSGELEQAADVVLMLYREDQYKRDSAKRGITEVIVRKHRRFGRLVGRVVQLLYDDRYLDLLEYRV